jgi:hypothetical protein
MILFATPEGPKISYEPDGMLHVEDLNQQVKMRWHMTRGEMFRLAVNCLRAAILRRA